MQKLTQVQKELCDELYNDTQIDLEYAVVNDMPEDIDAMMDYLQERVYEIECIYYHNAMEYLKENDPSLQESLGLAHDMGSTLENLNSETLATLLMQQKAGEVIWEYKDRLDEAFYSNNDTE